MKFFFLALISLFAIICFGFGYNQKHSNVIKSTGIINFGKCLATDLDIEEYTNEQIVFSLHTSCIKVTKKKKGFLCFGFWKVGELENLSLNFYQYTDQNSNANYCDGVKIRKLDGAKLKIKSFKLTLKHKKLMSILPKNIKGFKANNINLNIFQNDLTILSLKSDRAQTSFSRNKIIFEGNVALILENGTILKCKKINFLFKSKTLKTGGIFTLKTRQGIINGKSFEVNVPL